jgi:hypothetical protein
MPCLDQVARPTMRSTTKARNKARPTVRRVRKHTMRREQLPLYAVAVAVLIVGLAFVGVPHAPSG